jgi:glycosyltransferase involved in cell wall biosynthesis
LVTSVVLPVHNQADHIRGVVGGYVEALDRLERPYEVLLVTNGCTDASVEVSTELAGEVPAVETFDLERGGWGRAVKAGLAAARGDFLCYTNCARTTPEMLTLLMVYSQAYQQVVLKANRRIRDNWRRRLGSLVYNLECRALFDLPVWDINGTPKLFPRSFQKLLALQRDDDLIDLEFVATCAREGYPVLEVPLLATQRHGGRSTTNYRSAARMYWGAYRMAKAAQDAPSG